MSQEEKAIIISISALAINVLTMLINIGAFDGISIAIQNWQTERLNRKIKKTKDTKNQYLCH